MIKRRKHNCYLFRLWILPLVFAQLQSMEAHSKEADLDPKGFAAECLKGVTIYCIAAGMAEQKAGNLEQALGYYEAACKNHKTEGHLRACTPYLSLARELDKLDYASGELESRCRSGDEMVCFYLAKEYLKIRAWSRGYPHLIKLCEKDYRPPDSQDYGPCYHLGTSLAGRGKPDRAMEFHKLDCDRKRSPSNPNCRQYDALVDKIKRGHGIPEDSPKSFEPVEWTLLALVSMPFTGWVLLRAAGRKGLAVLRTVFPGAALICWIIWIVWRQTIALPQVELSFILPAVFLVFLLSFLAHKKIQDLDNRQ